MRKALGGLVIALCVAALAGASRTGTYQGGSYGQAGATYQAGGVAAGWDTVTIVYTTQDVLTDDNNPASIDTSLAWGRAPNTFATPAARDFARRDLFTQRLASADSVYRLGTGMKVPNFCWGVVSSMDTSGVSNGTNPKWFGSNRDTFNIVGTDVYALSSKFKSHSPLENTNNDGGRTAHMFYIPFAARHPARSTIVSATLGVVNAGNSQFTYLDSIYSVLMDVAGDDKWYTTKDAVDFANYPNMAHASWMRQESTNGGGWWNGTNRWPWSPPLNQRTYYWDWGSTSDWTGSPYGSTGAGEYSTTYIPTKTGYDIDVTDCVQAALNGTRNNGIILIGADGGATTNDWAIYGWDQYGDAKGREPYLVIKYITKRHQKPFGTSDFALVVSTDDGKYPANRTYADTFKAHDGKFTIYMAKNQLGANGGSTASQLVGFRTADGMEVGSHSRYHKTTHGLTFWHSIDLSDTISAGWDSLRFDVGPVWMYNMADTIAGNLRSDPLFAKTLALPESQLSPEVGLALNNAGYQAVRYKAMGPVVATWRHYSVANTKRAAAGDSASAGYPSYVGRAPRNMVLLPTTVTVQTIFGRRANAQTTEAELDSLKQNYRRLAYQIRGQDRGVISLFWHDFKTGYSVDYGGEGVDGIELGAVLDENDALGGRYMTVSEYAAWIKAGATAVDSPDRAAVPDTFESTAGQGVWYKPHGIDNRWIRGVK